MLGQTLIEVTLAALVVLPGLDGTATLHGDFITALDAYFSQVHVVAYPADALLDYPELEQRIRGCLPEAEPFVLLGESFSGPLAIAIAADPPANLQGVILSTTFARAPVPLSRLIAPFTRFAPVRSLPFVVLRWWLLGRWASPALDRGLARALRQVRPSVLRHRARSAMQVDVVPLLGRIHVPVLYLRATADRLLGRKAGQQIARAVGRCTLVDIAGPHLLLQAAATASAAVVKEQAIRHGWLE